MLYRRLPYGLFIGLLLAADLAPAADGGFENFRQDCAPNCSRQNLFDQGNTASQTAGNDEAGRARDLDKQAQANRDFADRVENDRQKLNDRLAGATPAERERILNSAYQPPEKYRELAKATGLSTNASLMRKGEEVSQAARDYAAKQAAVAQKMQQRASEGLAAASKLEKMSRTYEERVVRMQSVGESGAKASTGKGAPEISNGTGASTEQARGSAGRGEGVSGLSAAAGNQGPAANSREGRPKDSPESDSLASFQRKLTPEGSPNDALSDLKTATPSGAYKELLAKELGLDKPKDAAGSLLQTSADLDAHMEQTLRARGGRGLASIDESSSAASRSGHDVSLFKRVHTRLEIHQERGNLILREN